MGGLTVVLVVAAALLVRWYTVGYWDRLRAAVAEADVPPSFTEMDREEVGTTFCPVTCTGAGEPRITITYSYGGDPETACDVLREALERQYGLVRPPLGYEETTCAYAPLESVGEDAFVQVTSGCASECIVVFNSGID